MPSGDDLVVGVGTSANNPTVLLASLDNDGMQISHSLEEFLRLVPLTTPMTSHRNPSSDSWVGAPTGDILNSPARWRQCPASLVSAENPVAPILLTRAEAEFLGSVEAQITLSPCLFQRETRRVLDYSE